jgi:bifunctional non-homologous end joining protein LigD
MQEKWDGRRLLLHKHDGKITGINRRGLAVALPEPLVRDAQACAEDFTIDGEAIGDMLCAFDVLLVGDEDLRGRRYTERLLILANLLGTFAHPGIHLTETAHLPEEKRRMFDHLKSEGREGVVFKHVDAPYIAGRPASGGSQLKHKFHETASFIVGKINAKRSVTLQLLGGNTLVGAGNVTIPANQEIPAPGQIVECRYLYAFRESGCIYQPVYLGVRDDIRAEECTTAQLKYKAESEARAA